MTVLSQEFSNIVPVGRKGIIVSSFRFHDNGLEPIGNPSKEDWIECGRFILKTEDRLHFLVGDWLRYGELHWNDTYIDLAEKTGFKIGTLYNDKWVASQVDFSRRREKLSFSHHQA